jgi:trehalose 6-phosphate synthase/phosphatase
MEQEIAEQYTKSAQCLFLLDYDGTLAEFKSSPGNAHLTSAERSVIEALCQGARNTITVISGRDRNTLDQWLGDLPINLAAEYGHFIKEHGDSWRLQAAQDTSWKKTAWPILEAMTAQVPGSFIEEKEFSLVWHYRQADERTATTAAGELKHILANTAQEFGLSLMDGNKVVEIMGSGINKSAVARHWLQKKPWDFVLAAGDDAADEGLFQAMPEGAFTIKIGPGPTAAHYRLPDPKALSALFQRLNTTA